MVLKEQKRDTKELVCTWTEYKEFSVPMVSYFVTDGCWYYFMYGTLFTFILKLTSPAQLANLTLQVYPNSFKFLAAPIVDNYYITAIGKRKTWLLSVTII